MEKHDYVMTYGNTCGACGQELLVGSHTGESVFCAHPKIEPHIVSALNYCAADDHNVYLHERCTTCDTVVHCTEIVFASMTDEEKASFCRVVREINGAHRKRSLEAQKLHGQAEANWEDMVFRYGKD